MKKSKIIILVAIIGIILSFEIIISSTLKYVKNDKPINLIFLKTIINQNLSFYLILACFFGLTRRKITAKIQ